MPVTLPTPTYLTGDDVPENLRRVEIVTAGIDWPASTGLVTVTMEHIADAIRAANEDPHIQPPRIRLGHTSQLNGDMPRFDPFEPIGDAEPAFGRLSNLQAENDGAVLVADFDVIPDWLAAGAPSHYPNRSMEAVWQIARIEPQFDVETPAGKRYSMVITAVSLLGAYLPACRDLEDLQLLTTGGPAALAAAREEEETTMPAAELSVSYDTIRDRFNFDWATDPDNIFEDADGRDIDPYWWWARDIRVDPNEVIADGNDGALWRVPFTTDGEDAITFGDPVRVRETYVDVRTGTAASAATDRVVHVEALAGAGQQAVSLFARRRQVVAASFTERPTKPARTNPTTAASSRPEREENTMAPGITPEQFQRLRVLPEDADQAAIDAAFNGPQPETEPTVPAAEVEPAAPAAAPEPVAATARLPDGVAVVDSERLAKLEADAQAGARLARETAERDKVDTIAAALAEGRFPPARRAHYELMWDNDPEGTKHLLTASAADGGLAPGAVPTAARSHSNSDTGGGRSAHALARAEAAELRKADPALTQAGAMQQVFRTNPELAARYQDEVRTRAAA